MPKLENKTQSGTIVYIVLLIINCSTYVYNIYSVQQNKAYARLNVARQQSSYSAAVWHGTEHVSDAYSTVSTHLCLHLFWKIMLNRSLIVTLSPIYGLLKQIINHNRSKFVLSKLVLTGVCCEHVCTIRVHFLVCTWSVCLPLLWSDFYFTSKIPTIFL